MRKKPIVDYSGNAIKTTAILLNANQSHKDANSKYFPKVGHGYGDIFHRKWTTTEKIFAALFATSVALYGGNEVYKSNKYVKKTVDDTGAAMADSVDFIYHQLVGVPGHENPNPVHIAVKDSPVKSLGAANKTDVVSGNASEENLIVPPKYVLEYPAMNGNITIKGSSIQFIEDAVKSIAYLEEFYPEEALKCTKNIQEVRNVHYMNGLFGTTGVNASAQHRPIEMDSIATNGAAYTHEDDHSCKGYDSNKSIELNEKKPYERTDRVWTELIKVSKSKKEKFFEEFDFSKYKNRITAI